MGSCWLQTPLTIGAAGSKLQGHHYFEQEAVEKGNVTGAWVTPHGTGVGGGERCSQLTRPPSFSGCQCHLAEGLRVEQANAGSGPCTSTSGLCRLSQVSARLLGPADTIEPSLLL